MDAAIKEGFYVDPDSNKMFYAKKINGKLLIPFWVKSKPSDWENIRKEEKK